MKDVLEGIWKEAAVAAATIFLQERREITEGQVLANIRTEHFQNKILERYSQTSLVGN
jgi:hypothetical protein